MPADSMDREPYPTPLDPRRGSSGAARAGRARRSRRTIAWVLRGVAGAVSVVLLVGAGMANSLVSQFNAASGTGQSVGGLDGNVDAKGVDGKDMNILIVGNDSRQGYSQQQLQDELSTTGEDGMNTDTMMLVHVPANGARASVVSFPRDSYVSIPGYGKGKLNSAYADGYVYGAGDGATEQQKQDAGQAQLIKTISSLSGVHIDHYVTVTLLGFYQLTQALGGIEVNLCAPAKDSFSGIDLPAGKSTLDGKQALSFVRQRHNLAGGDLDRIKRQQYFIGAVIRKLLDQNLLDLLNYPKLKTLIDSLSGVITWDQDLDVFALAEQMREIAAGNVEFRTIPIADPAAKVDGQDVILPADDGDMKAFFAGLNQAQSTKPASASSTAAAPATVDPGTVTVDVVNASGSSGLGTETAQKLSTLGFVEGEITKDTTTPDTVIAYPTGQEAQANTLLAQVPGATIQADASLSERLRLTLGSGFTGVAGSTSSAAGSTTNAPQQTAAGAGCIN